MLGRNAIGCGDTEMLSEFDVDFSKAALPPYVALTEWLPSGIVVVEKLATPPDKAAVPIVVPLSRNVTEPEGAVVPLAALTVAVKVTVEFTAMLSDDVPSKVVVLRAAGEIVMETAEEPDGWNEDVPS